MTAGASLRAQVVEILHGIGELNDDQAKALTANPGSDLDFGQLTFDSLNVLGFCLDLETKLGVVLSPDEMVEIPSLAALETVLRNKNPKLA
jgi:acyl carrier protein